MLRNILNVSQLNSFLSFKNKSSYFCVLIRLLLLQIDHFGFLENGTFKQRYLLNDQHWHKEGGPILFYTGNEGDITWFCNNTVNMHLKKQYIYIYIYIYLLKGINDRKNFYKGFGKTKLPLILMELNDRKQCLQK